MQKPKLDQQWQNFATHLEDHPTYYRSNINWTVGLSNDRMYVRVLWSQCFFYNFQLSILAKSSGTILQPPLPPFHYHSSPNRSPEKISTGRPAPRSDSSEISWHMAHLRRKDFKKQHPGNMKTLGYLERKQQEKHDVLIQYVLWNKNDMFLKIIMCKFLGFVLIWRAPP